MDPRIDAAGWRPTPPPTARRAPAPAAVSSTAGGRAEEAAARDRRDALDRATEVRRRVLVDYHAASHSYVHRIVDAHTGEQVRQFPAEQVLDLVADVVRRMRATA